jgi:hypothetical protein
MRTFDRMGVHIEQCDGCRGVFLDYGELESITRLEAQLHTPPPAAPAPPPAAYPAQPAWGAAPQQIHHHHGGHHGYGYGHRKHHGLSGLFFSS